MSRLLFAIVTAALLPAFSAADWPVFRGDATMTGAGRVNFPTGRLPDQLDERWTFKCGDAVESAPAVVGDTVYVTSLDKHLYALELATGKQKWKVKLGAMKASPGVKGGRVYVGTLDGVFYCVDADGKVVWKFEAEGEIQASANFHGDNVLFGSHDSNLYCLSPDGKKLWATAVDGPINAAAAVVGDRTFATGCENGVLHVIDAKTGKELGNVDLNGSTVATAAVVGDSVFACMESNQVVAADLKNLKKTWAFEAPKRQQPFHGSPAAAAGLVVAGSRDKKVYALDAATGTEKWNFATAGQVDASPVIVGDRVYVGCLSDDGNFYVLDLKTGKKVQELELDSPVGGSVAVGPDCVLVGTDKGKLFCLGKK
ncbi:Pyrrolo-quinoline quinone OS=Pirellula staleyi (strain ATCC 27377 / DSM 6068 / ICPB 4128) GN=Psta_4502 PE=4 SV=1: PQQ_2: PQQ_2: PQQ_2 [Gemmataceae bacterium]|nr:Pyrrolo-quinoline quinone OS=Pirellula staleyi (strain ATCC 27377 / DSM 6068 / ICPB 4128) GN=Psta_4502 PE=4 SV=1: PQQ_2: PQQ_2: PQQ_2 [Gemmataceae bacterium]VTT96962.1 Pyrrolo-quinoline quinone OS=Pirellula staleyi (strain ATCC 27377 / DSM 6068 / ICPB 4128) GN=Psta_4502 PE=4 SV=1: PQQ_2: PQQ_2: PQQ_2 [Gemmataceae bacterium]